MRVNQAIRILQLPASAGLNSRGLDHWTRTKLLQSNLTTGTIVIVSCARSLATARTTAARPKRYPSKRSYPSALCKSSSRNTSPRSPHICIGKAGLTVKLGDTVNWFHSLGESVSSGDDVTMTLYSVRQ